MVRSRTFVVAGVVVLLAWRACRSDPSPTAKTIDAHLQTAVVDGGFAFRMFPSLVIEVDRDNRRGSPTSVRLPSDGFRVVGLGPHLGIGWQSGKRVHVGELAPDGTIANTTTWGRSVRQLCEGAASNEHRFGIGWLESNGRVWMVHGNTQARAEVAATFGATGDIEAQRVTWCAIASAEDRIALLWRDGRNAQMNFCNRRGCSELVTSVRIDAKSTLLGVGCVRDACLFATRDPAGKVTLRRVTERGKILVKSLDHVDEGSDVAVVGVGPRGFAIAYVGVDRALTVRRVGLDGALSNLWHGEGESMALSLAWAHDKLLVAEGTGATKVIDVPR